jgi:hypothetical protein
LAVRIEPLTGDQLIANGDDFCTHDRSVSNVGGKGKSCVVSTAITSKR